ncbi:MAG: hypothetical protein Kow0062_18800 [Acidobacteriota bacterium]
MLTGAIAAWGSVVVADTITIMPASCAEGIAGSAQDNSGLVISFEACPQGSAGFTSEIRNGRGDLMTEVDYDGTEVAVLIGGARLDEDVTTSEERAVMVAVLESEWGPLASRLGAALLEYGFDEASLAFRAMRTHAPIYEDRIAGSGQTGGCTSPLTGCFGCCGRGCSGCEAFGRRCTPECYDHDECVEQFGLLAAECDRYLFLAILSMLRCMPCNLECIDGPEECCNGQGPACIKM